MMLRTRCIVSVLWFSFSSRHHPTSCKRTPLLFLGLNPWPVGWQTNIHNRFLIKEQLKLLQSRRAHKSYVMYCTQPQDATAILPISLLHSWVKGSVIQKVGTSLWVERAKILFGLHPNLSVGYMTRNSSGDEIANVNFLYDDIVHVIQNTIDSCINSATDRRGYVLERMCLPNSVN